MSIYCLSKPARAGISLLMEHQLTINAAVDLPYTACYCEENTYYVLTSLAQGRGSSTECYAVFVSNEINQVDCPSPFDVLHRVS